MDKITRDNITFPGMTKVKLTKVSEREDAEVPNNIPVEDYRIGWVRDNLLIPIIGMRYGIENVININGKDVHFGHYFITSEVVEIIENNSFNKIIQFKTLNSIYKVEII